MKEKNIAAEAIVKNWLKHQDVSTVYHICNGAKNGRIHHELFRDIVFPVIKNGVIKNNERDVIAAIRCIQNFYKNKHMWEQIGFMTEFEMLTRLIASGSTNEWVIQRYIDAAINWLQYCIHEWPHGVLYGMDGASLDECDAILLLINSLRLYNLDKCAHKLLNDVETKTQLYKQRLTASE